MDGLPGSFRQLRKEIRSNEHLIVGLMWPRTIIMLFLEQPQVKRFLNVWFFITIYRE